MNDWRLCLSFPNEQCLTDAASKLSGTGAVLQQAFAPYAVDVPAIPSADTRTIPRASVVGGLVGAVVALGFQAWASAVSWPMDIGGKPVLAWLAYVPMAFEGAVLGAALATAGVFLRTLRSAGPGCVEVGARPDRFVLIVAGTGSDQKRVVRELCTSFGAQETESLPAVLRDPSFYQSSRSVDKRAWRWAATATLVVATGLAILMWPDADQPRLTYAPDMADSPAVRADATTALERTPPPNAISRSAPLPLHLEPGEAGAARAGAELLMPEDAMTAPSEAAGAGLFVSFCQPCHGRQGHGDGPTIKRGFQPPPSLLTQRTRDLKDGQLFHILTFGQKFMPAQAGQLSVADRWLAVAYVRKLQQVHPVDPPPFGAEQAPPP